MGHTYVAFPKAPLFHEGGLLSLGWLRVKMVTSTLDPVFVGVFLMLLFYFLFCLRLCRAAKGMFEKEVLHDKGIT